MRKQKNFTSIFLVANIKKIIIRFAIFTILLTLLLRYSQDFTNTFHELKDIASQTVYQ